MGVPPSPRVIGFLETKGSSSWYLHILFKGVSVPKGSKSKFNSS
jgi:hypothetical protein